MYCHYPWNIFKYEINSSYCTCACTSTCVIWQIFRSKPCKTFVHDHATFETETAQKTWWPSHMFRHFHSFSINPFISTGKVSSSFDPSPLQWKLFRPSQTQQIPRTWVADGWSCGDLTAASGIGHTFLILRYRFVVESKATAKCNLLIYQKYSTFYSDLFYFIYHHHRSWSNISIQTERANPKSVLCITSPTSPIAVCADKQHHFPRPRR